MNLSKESFVLHDFIRQTLCDRTQSSQTQTTAALAISSLYIPLAIAILLGNTVILIALKKERSLHPPSKLLLFNLVSTDLGVAYHRTTSLHSIYHVHSLQTLGDLSIDRDVYLYGYFHFVWCVSSDSDCHKCGQITCTVEEDAIQTNCHCEARSYFTVDVLD